MKLTEKEMCLIALGIDAAYQVQKEHPEMADSPQFGICMVVESLLAAKEEVMEKACKMAESRLVESLQKFREVFGEKQKILVPSEEAVELKPVEIIKI